MLRSALTLAAAGAVALSALSSAAFATPKNGFVIYKQDGDTVKKIYDDGRLDGRGCIIGKVAVFDPFTGGLKVVPKVRCNF
jgi:hypothetical protein